jgi:hypothetical protein
MGRILEKKIHPHSRSVAITRRSAAPRGPKADFFRGVGLRSGYALPSAHAPETLSSRLSRTLTLIVARDSSAASVSEAYGLVADQPIGERLEVAQIDCPIEPAHRRRWCLAETEAQRTRNARRRATHCVAPQRKPSTTALTARTWPQRILVAFMATEDQGGHRTSLASSNDRPEGAGIVERKNRRVRMPCIDPSRTRVSPSKGPESGRLELTSRRTRCMLGISFSACAVRA